MIAAKTGDRRLRAGVPAGWRVGDKTGSGEHGTANTVAILWPPGRLALFAAVYLTGARVGPAGRDAAHAAVGRLIAETL